MVAMKSKTLNHRRFQRIHALPLGVFNAYYSAIYELFKSHRSEIVGTTGYRNWRTFDLPDGLVLNEVPTQWRGIISATEEMSNLIYAIETGLTNIYEICLYHFLRSTRIRGFQADLSGLSLIDHINAVAKLQRHLSCESKIDEAFAWFINLQDSPTLRRFLTVHKEIIEVLSLYRLNSSTGKLFSDLYLQAFPLTIRKYLGEEYTPCEVADFILDCVGYTPDRPLMRQKLLDPAAGQGIFMIRALKRLLQTYQGNDFIGTLSQYLPISGVELKFFSAKAAQLNLMLQMLIQAQTNSKIQIQTPFPRIVHQGNALVDDDANQTSQIIASTYDYVVGNPPYLRIQNIKPESLKSYYVNAYSSARGRFDLSFLFIEKGLNCLNSGGCLGYITTNKFLTVAAGQSLRSLIMRQSTIERLVDLGDTQFFRAAVLPCILILRKGDPRLTTDFQYAAVTKLGGHKRSVDLGRVCLFDLLNRKQDDVCFRQEALIANRNGAIPVCIRGTRAAQPGSQGNTWHFLTPFERRIIAQMRAVANTRLSYLADRIMVGIKSTADQIFIEPMTRQYIIEQGFEPELLHPLLRGKNIQRWRISWSAAARSDRYILYPHRLIEGKLRPISLTDYPVTAAYLRQHRAKLSQRSYLLAARRKWYEIWVTQHPDYFARPYKLMTPDFALGNTFALDTEGFYLGTSALCVILSDQTETFNYYILGLLNSALYEFFHDP